ncbi:MFS transporter [Marinitoga sp. 1135]|uniref:Major Facilitator Superfamily transporter n=1 Tax=Marinitoga piezophila (strain DSM 14283 / JCM 11233 / KA3) TaxID=443254 RepID=H2J7B8_MARPK|nr:MULTISPECIES: MFS transporter [Marinitoga]AEX85310.1 Major Facilitator Superfamily transporter [Marinitoga piezophila KA3]APT75795.1 MFS transporter [Marinitoga sp. 1137]NUU95534.1 MFS transporter [Marinitoga sp. 1135]NUU97461.1 MFS transporter [Marinitoga sp. 1138]
MKKLSTTLKLSVLEAMAFNAFFVATQTFIIISIALYFNASPFQISIISSFPVFAQMFQVFTPLIYKLFGTRKKSLIIVSIIGRGSLVLLPIIVLLNIRNSHIFVMIMILYAFFGTFISNIWTAAMRELVPFEDRGKYFGMRNVFASAIGILATYLYSQFLDFPNEKMGILLVTSIMALFAVITIILLAFHKIPEICETSQNELKIKKAFQDKKFQTFLVFVGIWTFAIELTRPYFSYFQVAILHINTTFLGKMSVITGIISLVLYPFYGKLSDRYGNKSILMIGISLATIAPLLYFVMTDYNYRSLLLLDSVFSAFAWAAINLTFFNLLLETISEPAENYVAAYALTSGVTAIIASNIGGFFGNILKDKTFYILGDKYHGIQLLIFAGFLLRIYALLHLTNVEAYEKPIRYKSWLLSNPSLFKRREISLPIYLKIFRGKKLKKK